MGLQLGTGSKRNAGTCPIRIWDVFKHLKSMSKPLAGVIQKARGFVPCTE